MISNEQEAKAYVASFCDEASLDRLKFLEDALKEENERQNLVARSSLGSIWRRHIADSVQLLDHTEDCAGPWFDLGSGAGFPGIVIAICRPDLQVHLVESRRRRIEWLEQIVCDLQLPNCSIEGSRLELVPSLEANVISARAFAPLSRLLELSARFSTARTRWVLPKGRSAAQELSQLPSAQNMFHVEQSRTDADAGIIVGTGRWRA